MNTGYCECGCGQQTAIFQGKPRRFIHNHHMNGKFNYRWKGHKISHGYSMTKVVNHYRAHKGDGYVYDHILKAESALDKPLPPRANIHHFPRNPSNQLVICQNMKYHKLLHIRYRALKNTGDVNQRQCRLCKEYDSLDNLSVTTNGDYIYHKRCAAKYQNNRRDG